MLKITSPITAKNKIENISKQLPKDVAFDIMNPASAEKKVETNKNAAEDTTKQFLLKNLNKEIYEPLLNSTKAQADQLRKLVLMIKLFETSSGIISQDFIDKLFLKPEQLLSELLTKDKNETIFKGDLFDSLRALAKIPDQPKLKEAIVLILKSFDFYVKQENSLKAIVIQSNELAGKLTKSEAKNLNEAIQKLVRNIDVNKENHTQIRAYIKNKFVPHLITFVKNNKGNEKIYNNVMSVIHNVMRYDKADQTFLEDSILKFGEELSRLTSISNDDIVGMKKLAFEHADKALGTLAEMNQEEKPSETMKFGKQESDVSSLIGKALDGSAPAKISGAAQNLLLFMLQSESPVLPFMHYTIPLTFLGENTFGEFFIDKDCRERKGEAENAKNIFFTIQSDKYGNFEVDLLEKDKFIELDVRCPDILLNNIKDFKARMKNIIEDQGYRLSNYQVGVYRDNHTTLERFPKLALRKVGVDVKI